MRVYPFIKLSRTLLLNDGLYSVNCFRLASRWPVGWSGGSRESINSRYTRDGVTDCLTTSLVNQMSNPVFNLIVDLTSYRLSSLYLKCYHLARSINQSWSTSVSYFADDNNGGMKGAGQDPAGGRPIGNQYDELMNNLPPLLMDFIDPMTTPGPISTIKNLFTMFFIIKPTYDASFTYAALLEGSKQALCVISNALSKGETTPLEDLVDPEALKVIRENLVKFTPSQLADLKVDEADVIFWLAKEISTIERDDRKFIEVTFIFHVIKGYQEKMASQERRPFFMPDPDMTFCNYRFIREYTKGVNGEWTCNRLNHFKLGHFLKASPFGS